MNEIWGEEKKNVPAPPGPEIAIRTMESDLRSIAESGGVSAAPEFIDTQPRFNPDRESKAGNKATAEINIAGYAGPEKSIFETTGSISQNELSSTRFKMWKAVVLIVGFLLGAAILWLLGYYVIFPWIFR